MHRFDVKMLGWFARTLECYEPFGVTVHKTVEKEGMELSYWLSIVSSMSCVVRVLSFCTHSLHQQSALTIASEVFTFAPVDG